MISYNVVVGDTLSKVLVRFIPTLGASMGSVRFFVVFLVTLVSIFALDFYDDVRRAINFQWNHSTHSSLPFAVCHDATLLVQKRVTSRQNQLHQVSQIESINLSAANQTLNLV